MTDSDDATVPEDGPDSTAPETAAEASLSEGDGSEDPPESFDEPEPGDEPERDGEADLAGVPDRAEPPNPADELEDDRPAEASGSEASSQHDDAPPSGEREPPGRSSVVEARPGPPTFPKEETMATGNPSSSGTCGALHNPGNSNPSTLTLTGHKPHLVITYAKTGTDPLRLTFDNNAKMVLCPGSSACYDMKGVGEVVIHYTSVAQFTWCWTDEATSCCKDGK